MSGVDALRRTGERSVLERVADGILVLVSGVAVRGAEWAGIERTLRAGAALGRGWHALGGPRTRRVRAQLAAALPEVDAKQRARWEREVFVHLGRGLAELLLMSGRHRDELLSRVQVIGLEHLQRATRDSGGLGAVVIAPHLGNWELGAAKLSALGVRVSAVYRGRRQPAFERALRQARIGRASHRSDTEPRVDPVEAIEQIAMGRRAGVQLVRALEAGRHALVLLDQRARGDEGLEVEFFGRPARTRFGPLKLADRVGASVVLAFALREPDARHHTIMLTPAPYLEPGASRDEAILRENLQRVTAAIEAQIRAHPNQWIWTHRRWRIPRAERHAE